MCSNDQNSFQCLHGGWCSSNNTCICASACYVGSFCEINYNAAILPLTGAVTQDVPSSRNVYLLVFSLFGFIGLVNNILALTTFTREQIRISAHGIYLILFSLLNIGLMINILTYILTIVEHDNATYKFSACHVIPFICLIMTDGGVLCTVAIAVERVFIECFNASIQGSRTRSFVVSVLIIIYVAASNIDEIFLRRITTDISGKEVCTYDFDGYPAWRQCDIIFSYTHVILPCVAHLICSICVLTTIARRKIFIGSTDNKFCGEWMKQLYLHRDFFIPPLCLVVCILPHGILGHLLYTCIPYSNIVKLRLHIVFVLLLFVPQMLSFVLYVYPSDKYWNEFQQTFLYRKLCCYHYRRQQRLQHQQQLKRMLERRMTVCTINCDNMISRHSKDFS